MGLIADRAVQFSINQSSGRIRAHENEFSQLADLKRPSYSISNQGLKPQVLAGVLSVIWFFVSSEPAAQQRGCF